MCTFWNSTEDAYNGSETVGAYFWTGISSYEELYDIYSFSVAQVAYWLHLDSRPNSETGKQEYSRK